jgi:hypothetical protein
MTILGPNDPRAIRLYRITLYGIDTPKDVRTVEKRTDAFEIARACEFIRRNGGVVVKVDPPLPTTA